MYVCSRQQQGEFFDDRDDESKNETTKRVENVNEQVSRNSDCNILMTPGTMNHES